MHKEISGLIKYLSLVFVLQGIAYISCYFWMCIFFSSLVDEQDEFLIKLFSFDFFYEIFPIILFIVLTFIASLFIILTKTFLDKKESKYLTCFFDNLLYPTIALLIVVLCRIYFNLYISYLIMFIAIYFVGFIRKFAKPLYNHISIVIFLLWGLVIYCIMGNRCIFNF